MAELPSALSEAFAAVLRESREATSMSQTELAKECGIDRSYLNMLEQGKASPTLKMLFQLADYLGVPPEELVARTKQRLRVGD